MALDHGIQALLQRLAIQGPQEAHSAPYVIGRALFVQQIDKPHALLRIGQGDRLVARYTDQRRKPAFLLSTRRDDRPGHQPRGGIILQAIIRQVDLKQALDFTL